MSIFNDKALKSVAEAAAKIMGEQLKGNQHKIDANKNGKVDAHDFKLLRAGKKPDMKKEDVEQLDEVGDTPAGRKALSSYVQKALHDKDRQKGLRKATSRLYKDNYYGKKTNEEVEQLQEYESKGGVFRHTAKLEKGAEYGASDYSKGGEEEKEAKKMTSSPKRASKGYGARQNFVRSTRVNEKKKVNEELSFTEMLELYNEHGLKVLAPIETEEMDIDGTTIEVIDADKVNGVVTTEIEEGIMDVAKGAAGVVKNVINKEKAYQAEKQKKAGEVLSKMRREEVTNDQFTKEFEDQRASFEGKKPQPKVAAGKTTGVKEMPESVQQIDELSNDKMKAYIKKAAETDKDLKRGDGVYRAMKKIAGVHGHVAGTNKKQNEEVELEERTLTSGESKKKEEYVKGMKKGLSGFKQRYGERAKSVMYATATKMAKKD
jgi:hypothetical protein